VEIAGEGGDEGFAFAGLHFADLALVENHAADELDVEVAHLDGAPAGLADYGEGFGQNFVEGGAFGLIEIVGVGNALHAGGDAGAELGCFGTKLFIGKLFHLRLKGAYLGDDGEQFLDDPLVGGAEYFGECLIEKHRNLRSSSINVVKLQRWCGRRSGKRVGDRCTGAEDQARQGGGRWKSAGSKGDAGAWPKNRMDAAEARERGDTSPTKKTGSIATHARELTVRNIACAWRREPGCPN